MISTNKIEEILENKEAHIKNKKIDDFLLIINELITKYTLLNNQ